MLKEIKNLKLNLFDIYLEIFVQAIIRFIDYPTFSFILSSKLSEFVIIN